MKTLQNPEYTNVNEITNVYDYRQAVLYVADSVINAINEAIAYNDCEWDQDSVEEFLNDSCLHEQIDQSEWIIYTRHHLPIIQHADNIDYAIDNFGTEWAGETLKEVGLDGLHSGIAFWALYEDVKDIVQDIINDTDFDLEEDQDTEEEEV
jgi:hypothetical protein